MNEGTVYSICVVVNRVINQQERTLMQGQAVITACVLNLALCSVSVLREFSEQLEQLLRDLESNYHQSELLRVLLIILIAQILLTCKLKASSAVSWHMEDVDR